MKFVRAIPRYAKAVAGAVTSLGASVGLALEDGVITGTEWWGIGAAVLVGAGLVGAIPNKPPAEPPVLGYGPRHVR